MATVNVRGAPAGSLAWVIGDFERRSCERKRERGETCSLRGAAKGIGLQDLFSGELLMTLPVKQTNSSSARNLPPPEIIQNREQNSFFCLLLKGAIVSAYLIQKQM